ncbi:MAG: Nif3-like dinuclear metal center hexameric protein [Lachnospiraceae bacterium]|nr:Nif3-like dinuclear metal center hexameric protein [Candidatus Merdinaster equi]
MRCGDIISKLEELSPESYALSWDNVGLLIGRRDKEVNKVCIALDATSEVIEQAVKMNADMILTHHPLIFKGTKKICQDDYVGKRIIKLIQNDICLVAMHTNFDVMGMADAAADELNLKGREVLEITSNEEGVHEGLGRYGRLPHIMTLRECAEYVKEVFKLPQVVVYGDLLQDVERMAVLPGSGRDEVALAKEVGADVYLTGDISHHAGIDAVEMGINVIDAGHFGIEQIFVPYMKDFFIREMRSVVVEMAKQEIPFSII